MVKNQFFILIDNVYLFSSSSKYIGKRGNVRFLCTLFRTDWRTPAQMASSSNAQQNLLEMQRLACVRAELCEIHNIYYRTIIKA